jgi:hypothetical protein
MITSSCRDGLVALGSTHGWNDQRDAAEVIGSRRSAPYDQQPPRREVGNGRSDLRCDHTHYGAGVQQSPDGG